jgi:phosphotransferase system HPr (HPr) family protein
MNGETLQRTVIVTNPQGFHLRPMAAFVQKAAGFAAQVTLRRDGITANGKSILELMQLQATYGTELTLCAAGPDAQQALDALVTVLQGPGEEACDP